MHSRPSDIPIRPTTKSVDNAYQEYLHNTSAPLTNTGEQITEALRKQYPELHVTTLLTNNVDLLSYAAAGHAQATPIQSVNSENEEYRIRTYSPPARRLDGGSGVLYDSIRFGRFMYKWKNHEYILYTALGIEYYTRSWAFLLGTPEDNDRLVFEAGKWSVEIHKSVWVFDGGYWQQSAELWRQAQDAKWEDVILEKDMKKSVVGEISKFYDSREKYQRLKVPWKRGLIFRKCLFTLPHKCALGKSSKGLLEMWGNVLLVPLLDALESSIFSVLSQSIMLTTVSGRWTPWQWKNVSQSRTSIINEALLTGCSRISIKAMMHSLYSRPSPVPTLYVRSLTSFRGPEYSLSQIFSRARQMAPCFLVFEDLDSIVTDAVRSYFLNEVDGLENNDGILMLGSTNHLERLDPGISKRPSRFDRKYLFPDPDFEQRVKYCEFWRHKLAENDDVDFPGKLCRAIANITKGFSFAYIQEAFVAALLAIANGDAGEEERVGTREAEIGPANVKWDGLFRCTVADEDDLEKYVLWREMKKVVKTLREELESRGGVTYGWNDMGSKFPQ